MTQKVTTVSRTTNTRYIRVDPVTGNIGAEISGIDLSADIPEAAYAEIKAALNEHAVLFFREQQLELEEFAKFGEHFGPLLINNSPSIKSIPGYPMIEDLRKEPHEVTNIGDEWHTDQAHRKNPCMGTILQAVTVPKVGGDTLFINTAAVYESLPQGIKETIAGLRGIHSSSFILSNAIAKNGDPDSRFANVARASEEAVHPVVKVHPETGRKSLFVSPGYTVRFDGWTREDSKPLLDVLYKHAFLPEFCCRFRWRERSIAFWDNRLTWHYATNDYHGQRRVMRRLVVQAAETAK